MVLTTVQIRQILFYAIDNTIRRFPPISLNLGFEVKTYRYMYCIEEFPLKYIHVCVLPLIKRSIQFLKILQNIQLRMCEWWSFYYLRIIITSQALCNFRYWPSHNNKTYRVFSDCRERVNLKANMKFDTLHPKLPGPRYLDICLLEEKLV